MGALPPTRASSVVSADTHTHLLKPRLPVDSGPRKSPVYLLATPARLCSTPSGITARVTGTGGARFPDGIHASDVRGYLSALQEAEAKPATIHRRRAGLASFFRWALAAGHCHESPMEGLEAAGYWVQRSGGASSGW
jgi:hypothetical protein